MPDVAAGTLPIVFGDFRRGYGVLSRTGVGGVSILRDPFSLATAGQVRFHARLRVGGRVIQPEAMVLMQIGVQP